MKSRSSSKQARGGTVGVAVPVALVGVLALFNATACDGTLRPPQEQGAASSKPIPTDPRDGSAGPATALPLRLISFVDQSASMEGARVAPVTAASFAPIYARLAVTGGELAVGLIRDDSNRPFARLFVPAPPARPAWRPLPANVFAAASVRREQSADEVSYGVAHRAWRVETARRQAQFERAIAPLLERAANAPSTDIYSAFRRADVLLSELGAFRGPTRNIVVLVSDGIETATEGVPPSFGTPAEILLVNGAGEIGSLAPFGPVRFESLDAALRYVVSEEGTDVRR